ncbi:UDP-N-acetylmuramoyl-L-alanyl-D-glutamate--2,6-diaminopimelate ligase [Falsibacillus pallidus]|uniref:UDP-N-acetylmuramoyl-L-alanyl-D-glutamate--2,6-diaminopimelate ligase n=1 Tax=Falsibacillus pallidus TaxID=493781 RepID=A0A370H0H4_9BACI|nr:UDP-N-acetylmuramoyl-L-alanyl-D-glutamate--2,6-diaminopimelate ligase [Falsibacillus pallidus]RDI47553.1 UDP-N-acetylmuramoylalanyl-D-glutamate--2,6-diaminopimelate ligase [Falsibacillus pallidus]
MKLHTLLDFLPLVKEKPAENPEILSVENDNRKVNKGSLFICIEGLTNDGHNFAKDAEEKGAAAVLAERPLSLSIPVILVKDTKRAMAVLADAFYGQPTKQLHLIGITGTNGKTTTSHLIEHVMLHSGLKTGLIGTMYVRINDRIIETKNTTPESLTLQQTFHEMVNEDVDTAIMEVSSHALVQGRVHGCDYDVAVFTNLTQDHLDYHKTMDEYRRAKGLLFAQLGNTYDHEKPKVAVLNADDAASEAYITETAAHVMTYSIDNNADFTARNIQMDGSGMKFDLHYPEGSAVVTLKLVGKFSVYNALAAIAACYASNIPMDIILDSLAKMEGVPGRFELVDAGQEYPVIVDYAHTPDSLENVLKTVAQIAKNKIYVVVGCGGDRDKTKRPLMAKIACKYASNPIFTSDNPRSEDPYSILKDMESGVQGENYEVIEDRKEAIRKAVQQASAGDVVLIAGKGHETYQIVGDKVLDFDDRIAAAEAIKEKE